MATPEPHPLAEDLARARRDAGLAQRHVAAVLHVTTKTVSNWERGHSEPSLDCLSRWAEALGLRVQLASEAADG